MSDSKLLNSIIWKFFERASVQIINMITQIILARILAPEQFGSLSLIIVIYNLIDLFVQKGFSSSLIRKKDVTKYDLDSTFLVSFTLSIILYVLMFYFAPVIGNFYDNNLLVNPLRVLMVNLLFSPLYCIGNAILIRQSEFKTIFYRGLFASIISGGLGIYLAIQGFGLWALVSQVVLNQITITIFIYTKVNWKPGTNFSYQAFKEVFSFGKNIVLTEFLLYFVENIRTIIIGKKYSRTELAYYDRGQVYPATLMRAINDTIFSTLLPHLSRYQDDKSKIISEYIQLTYLSLFLVVPIFIGFASIANEVVIVLLTDTWLPTVPFIQIFCVYQAIFPYQITGKIAIYAIGNSKSVFYIEILKSMFSLILMLLTMNYGVHSIAISLIFVRLISDYLYSKMVERIIDEKVNIIKYTWKPFLGALVMFFAINIVNYFDFKVLLSLAIKIIVGFTTYVIIYYFIDKELMENIAKNVNKLLKL